MSVEVHRHHSTAEQHSHICSIAAVMAAVTCSYTKLDAYCLSRAIQYVSGMGLSSWPAHWGQHRGCSLSSGPVVHLRGMS